LSYQADMTTIGRTDRCLAYQNLQLLFQKQKQERCHVT
jgi:hypothetical protein